MKTVQILKAIVIGVFIGGGVFFVPFPFRFFFIPFFLFWAFWFFGWSRWRKNNYNSRYYFDFWNPSYTQRWQGMSEEERKAFISKMESELFAPSTKTE